jgi:hypothetical protein
VWDLGSCAQPTYHVCGLEITTPLSQAHGNKSDGADERKNGQGVLPLGAHGQSSRRAMDSGQKKKGNLGRSVRPSACTVQMARGENPWSPPTRFSLAVRGARKGASMLLSVSSPWPLWRKKVGDAAMHAWPCAGSPAIGDGRAARRMVRPIGRSGALCTIHALEGPLFVVSERNRRGRSVMEIAGGGEDTLCTADCRLPDNSQASAMKNPKKRPSHPMAAPLSLSLSLRPWLV